MVKEIIDKVGVINRSLDWIKDNRPKEYDQKFIMLVDERRKLRRIQRAAAENPAIAAFGESQKGKSYLMGNLLQNNGAPFMVKSGAGNEEVNFVQSINPIGDKKEATGVVTRFTTFGNDPSRYNREHPVIVKLLSPTAIATILCDSYHKDIMDYQIYSDDELKKLSQGLLDKYSSNPDLGLDVVTEDDVLEIKYYLGKYLTETQGLRRSNYFENLARVIRKVPVDDWVKVFSVLWHENEIISRMFTRLINVLQRLRFANELYTDIETVRHYGDNINTIMSVDCLNGLDDPHWDKKAVVYVKDGTGYVKVADIPKCELAAVCAETIYKVEREYVEDEMEYNIYEGADRQEGDMPEETAGKLKSHTVRKSLLGVSDLLDFPGARNRLKIQQGFLMNVNKQQGGSNMVQMLLRGKVAYLFNSYSESRIINILLFCHDAEAVVVNEMYIMIDDWVQKYVGSTPEKRKAMIEECGGVPPLFNICTKFNIDMKEEENPEKNNEAALKQRWSGRLKKVLYTQAFKADDVDWFLNWEEQGKSFKNTYLLRDYKYSACTGSGNNLWEGYKETDPAPTEKKMNLNPDFYRKMRESFVANKDLDLYFQDKTMAWDLAATRNNDGSLYIIDRLNTVADNASKARAKLFGEEIRSVARNVRRIIEGYYVSTDSTEILNNNIRKAKTIFRELDFTCNSDNYYFGHLLQALQMPEHESYKVVHKVILSPELIEKVNNFKDYEIIHSSCRKAGYPIDKAKTEAMKWECLIETYGLADMEDAMKYLERKGVDKDKLFSITFKRKLNSYIIADTLFEKWCEKIKSDDILNKLTGDRGFDPAVMGILVEALISSATALKLADIMAESISEYVDVVKLAHANEYLVADILSDTINDFVLDFGYSLLSDDDKEKARKVCEKSHLSTFNYMLKEPAMPSSEEELTALFDEMSESPKALLPSFEENYNRWIEYMFVSFVAHLDIPDFDRESNEKLKQLIDSLRAEASESPA